MLQQLFKILVVLEIISRVVNSYSACYQIDTHFIIDSDSIINNGDNIKQFIQSIIWNGSSEYSAFSVSLYGKNIHNNNNIIINLNDTHSVYQRAKQEKSILSQLETAFNSVVISSNNPSFSSDITITEAFKHSNDQFKPKRNYKKESVVYGMIFVFFLSRPIIWYWNVMHMRYTRY